MTIARDFTAAYRRSEASSPELRMVPNRLTVAVTEVTGVDGAGLGVVDQLGFPLPIGASCDNTAFAERLQFTVGQGPTYDARRYNRTVVATEDVVAECWPAYYDLLVTETPFRSVVALPLTGPLSSTATIALLFHDPNAADHASLADIAVLCRHITAALIEADLLTPADDADDGPPGQGSDPVWLSSPSSVSRRQVVVAASLLSSHLGVSDTDALKMLKAHAYANHSTTDDVAAALLAGHTSPDAFAFDSRASAQSAGSLDAAAGRMTVMSDAQLDRIRSGQGFFAALDQSGGSTPKALAEYGIAESRYSSEAEMFDLVHQMRTRLVTSPAFDGSHVLAAILFEQTMQRSMQGVPTAQYLWEHKGIVPFLKVDEGLADEVRGVQLMKPMGALDQLLDRAKAQHIFGTKMRSVVNSADRDGIADVVEQQFEYAARISSTGLVPILEPEVSIHAADKEQAESVLREELQSRVDALPGHATIMLKLTIPTQPDLYAGLAADSRVLRVLALSGGYDRSEACRLLAQDSVMIASFSRALLQGLTDEQTDDEFQAQLQSSVAEIYDASVHKKRGPAR